MSEQILTKERKWHQAIFEKQLTFSLVVSLLVLLILFSIAFSVTIGQVDVPLNDSFQILFYQLSGGRIGSLQNISVDSYLNVIWQIRLPRVLLALMVGIGLSVCGVIMQSAVQNPLADPYILGVSSGASFGATFAIMIGFGANSLFAQTGVAFWAFGGAFGASLLVLILSSIGGSMTSVKLVLSGMVVNALFNAFSNFIIYFANNAEGIRSVTFWSMGSLASASWDKLPLLLVTILPLTLFFLTQHRILNTMLLGDETAITLGINLSFFRKFYLLLTSLLTGVMVASCGMIGFVGLIVPHIVRGMVGSDHKRLLPLSVLFGALFMIWSDILSRVLIPNVELPIGIITALIGAPLFMYMLVKKGYNFGGN